MTKCRGAWYRWQAWADAYGTIHNYQALARKMGAETTASDVYYYGLAPTGNDREPPANGGHSEKMEQGYAGHMQKHREYLELCYAQDWIADITPDDQLTLFNSMRAIGL